MAMLLQNLGQGLKVFLSRRWIFLSIILTFSLPGSILAVLQRMFFSTQLLNPYFLLDTLMNILILSIGTYAAVRAAQGNAVYYTEALREGNRPLGKMLVVYLISYIAILIGLLFLIIPGIIIIINFALIPMVVLFEDTNIKQTFTRSIGLTKGYRWQLFAVLLIPVLILYPLTNLIVSLNVPSLTETTPSELIVFFAYHLAHNVISGVIMQIVINTLSVYYLQALHKEL